MIWLEFGIAATITAILAFIHYKAIQHIHKKYHDPTWDFWDNEDDAFYDNL